MDKILVDLREENKIIKRMFTKDFVSIDDILEKIEDLYYELEEQKEEFEDFKQDVEDNYRPLKYEEQL